MRTRTLAHTAPGRGRRSGERGFTLIELIVTMAISTLVAGALAGGFAAASSALRPGGVADHLAGANDEMVFEQVLSRDVSRASCVEIAGANNIGGCPPVFANATVATACAAARLCVAWPLLADSACHIAAYTQPVSPGVVHRTEYKVSSAGASTVETTGMGTDAFKLLNFTANTSGGAWLTSLTVTLTSALKGTGVLLNPTHVTLDLGVLVASPSGPGATAAILGAAQC